MDFNRLVQIDLAPEASSVLVDSNQTKIVQCAKRTKAHRLENPLGDGALHLDSAKTKGVRFTVLEKGCAHFSS